MKVHLSFATHHLDASVAFYRTLLQAEPVKVRDDYALFLTESPGLELAIDLEPEACICEGAHYGFAVETTEEVDDAIARLRAAGYPVDVETGETCCYAVQNKVWATDPDGRRWETYFVVEESQERDTAGAAACC
jgi:catechol 2,3-dioxygenase-like lactoylglutathione lyase family enzyme